MLYMSVGMDRPHLLLLRVTLVSEGAHLTLEAVACSPPDPHVTSTPAVQEGKSSLIPI